MPDSQRRCGSGSGVHNKWLAHWLGQFDPEKQHAMDEFEDVAFVARLPLTPTADGQADSRKRSAIAKVVSRVYRVANDALRADMLVHLLRPLGALARVAVASGAFARLLRHDGLVPDTISAEDIARYSSEQIRELTLFVHEVNPDALQPLVEQLVMRKQRSESH
jgi:hypothetical protein